MKSYLSVLVALGALASLAPVWGSSGANPPQGNGTSVSGTIQRNKPQPTEAAVSEECQAAAKASNQFATDLFGVLRREKGNVFYSPLSISTALTMTSNGADGDTLGQMAKTLHFDPAAMEKTNQGILSLMQGLNVADAEKEKRPYELSVANALWGQKGFSFRPEFIATLNKYYDSTLTEVDYAGDAEASRKTINTWVEDKTNQKIKELLKQGIVNNLTRLVLTNAVYFKGTWEHPFKKEATAEAEFTLEDGKKSKAPLMFQKEHVRYIEEKEFQAVALPYLGKRLEMVVLLPQAADGLGKLEEQLTCEKLDGWLKGMRTRDVEVFLPKFKMTCEYGLVGPLKTLGMRDAFDLGKADFSRIDGRKDLYITAVVHKAFVDVNEEGTEAAAATGVVIGLKSAAPAKPIVFRADHPFLFLIRDSQTGVIVFMGRVCDPKAE